VRKQPDLAVAEARVAHGERRRIVNAELRPAGPDHGPETVPLVRRVSARTLGKDFLYPCFLSHKLLDGFVRVAAVPAEEEIVVRPAITQVNADRSLHRGPTRHVKIEIAPEPFSRHGRRIRLAGRDIVEGVRRKQRVPQRFQLPRAAQLGPRRRVLCRSHERVGEENFRHRLESKIVDACATAFHTKADALPDPGRIVAGGQEFSAGADAPPVRTPLEHKKRAAELRQRRPIPRDPAQFLSRTDPAGSDALRTQFDEKAPIILGHCEKHPDHAGRFGCHTESQVKSPYGPLGQILVLPGILRPRDRRVGTLLTGGQRKQQDGCKRQKAKTKHRRHDPLYTVSSEQ